MHLSFALAFALWFSKSPVPSVKSVDCSSGVGCVVTLNQTATQDVRAFVVTNVQNMAGKAIQATTPIPIKKGTKDAYFPLLPGHTVASYGMQK